MDTISERPDGASPEPVEPAGKRRKRSITPLTRAKVLARDRWQCGYCRRAVFHGPALAVLAEQFPDRGYYHPNAPLGAMAESVCELCAMVDHVQAFAGGGSDEMGNLLERYR